MTVRIGTRSSRLALWQAARVAEALRAARPDLTVTVVEMSTHGDEVDRALPDIGGEGVFTERIERALLDGAVDIAVHSLKDLPVEPRADLLIGAVLDRHEVRETLVTRSGTSLARLAPGAVIGSSSTRRTAQLLALRPDLVVRPIRGNVETRIGKVDEGLYDATLLAGAGLERLGLAHRVSEWLTLADFLPAPGQGALAVQCRCSDAPVVDLLKEIDDSSLHAATDAERGFLGLLGCGCSAPVAALATVVAAAVPGARATIHMRVRISAADGSRSIDLEGSGDDPATLARSLAHQARAAGAEAILSDSKTAARARRGLSGLRVLVTRSREQAEPLCSLLSARGALPIVLPMIQVEPLPISEETAEAARSLTSFDWVVFTSAHGVDSFMRALHETAGAAAFGTARPAVAAVGPATAAALARWGVTATFIPVSHDAAALAAGIGAEAPRAMAGARVLFPRAERAREEVIEILRERGALVSDIPVYRTAPVKLDELELAEALHDRIDAVLFMSGSAVHAFCDLARGSGTLAALEHDALIAAMGRTTADAARSRGLLVHCESQEQTVEALLDTLARYVDLHEQAVR